MIDTTHTHRHVHVRHNIKLTDGTKIVTFYVHTLTKSPLLVEEGHMGRGIEKVLEVIVRSEHVW